MRTIYTAIDGDLADFLEAQRAVSDVFGVSELIRYLLNEGHALQEVDQAFADWKDTWLIVTGDSFRLSPDGEQAVEMLNNSV